jgi:hypothetical protein
MYSLAYPCSYLSCDVTLHGRFIWAKVFAESASKVVVGVAEEGAKKGQHDFPEAYSFALDSSKHAMDPTKAWILSRLEEDDHEVTHKVATVSEDSKNFWTGQDIEVHRINTNVNEDAGLAVILAVLLGELNLIV